MINVHPFPARMAPEIALKWLSDCQPLSVVLDPMTGSGTVVRQAAQSGLKAFGFDVDPLAVLISRVASTPIKEASFSEAITSVCERAKSLRTKDCVLHWIDSDEETMKFIKFWFAGSQRNALRRLATAIDGYSGPASLKAALKVALSRIIITKDRGASLARDVSHSRPHRVRDDNDFDVIDEFFKVGSKLAKLTSTQPFRAAANVSIGDARRLRKMPSGVVDLVITSPPYLNAIDYMRGHRLALVWLGYNIPTLRKIRSNSVGSERGLNRTLSLDLESLASQITDLQKLPSRFANMTRRYLMDMSLITEEVSRVLRKAGKAVFVVGDCCLRGIHISNSLAVIQTAQRAGLKLRGSTTRDLPMNKRYLPPPNHAKSSLRDRMRQEIILEFERR
jgi:hypothetical protein